MNLIVDCGATKAVWCAVEGARRWEVLTPGINFAQASPQDLDAGLDLAARSFEGAVQHVWFYGAGLVSARMEQDLAARLRIRFPGAQVECASDMVGAARAVCGREPGIAAILGTGANTCQWDGTRMAGKVPSGGFILGDEGSAAVLGRLFVTDFLKGFVPEAMARAFREQFAADYTSLVRGVYALPAPARYLGSFAPFVLSWYAHEDYARDLTDNNFRAFFVRSIQQYPSLPLGVVGGFGYACRDILRRIGAEYGIDIPTILENPINGLLQYHAL